MNVNNPTELKPWVIVTQAGGQASLALWRIAPPDTQLLPSEFRPEESEPAEETEAQAFYQTALAIFSDASLADQYALRHCPPTAQATQLEELNWVTVLAECYQQGIRYAALNPSDASVRQVFALREVLQAAKLRLKSLRS